MLSSVKPSPTYEVTSMLSSDTCARCGLFGHSTTTDTSQSDAYCDEDGRPSDAALDALYDVLRDAGSDAGQCAASWVELDRAAAYRLVSDEVTGEDPGAAEELWDTPYPAGPLSGEMADGPTPTSVLVDAGCDPDLVASWVVDEACTVYEDAYYETFRAEVVQAALATLDETVPEGWDMSDTVYVRHSTDGPGEARKRTLQGVLDELSSWDRQGTLSLREQGDYLATINREPYEECEDESCGNSHKVRTLVDRRDWHWTLDDDDRTYCVAEYPDAVVRGAHSTDGLVLWVENA